MERKRVIERKEKNDTSDTLFPFLSLTSLTDVLRRDHPATPPLPGGQIMAPAGQFHQAAWEEMGVAFHPLQSQTSWSGVSVPTQI